MEVRSDSLYPKSIKNIKIIKKRHRKDLDDNFVAPDGGYGWTICIAAGLSNLCLFSPIHAFGLIFHDKFENLGITGAQTTTILNIQTALRYCSGLLNGPIFRMLSYRQVGLIGALLATVGIFALSFANTFSEFVIWYSIIFGFGMGICFTATSLVVNTYFKLNRRRARSYQLALTSLGSIFFPYFVHTLLDNYGVQGTVMCFSAICFHCFAFALLYHPVKWHVKEENIEMSTLQCKYCTQKQPQDRDENKLNEIVQSDKSGASTEFKLEILKEENNDEIKRCNKCAENENLVQQNKRSGSSSRSGSEIKLKWYQKVIKFFDLDLLKDPLFINILLGLSLSNFGEQNSYVLTAFYLKEFGFRREQVAIIMSCQAIADLVMRFLTPFLTKNIKWDNKIFFLVSIVGLIICRVFIAFILSFEATVLLSVLVGSLRAFRTIFKGLIIPGYVPLNKLPAAEGLQLTLAGVLTLLCGPFVGLIKDYTNYSFTLNMLNIFSLITIVMWSTEFLYYFCYKKS